MYRFFVKLFRLLGRSMSDEHLYTPDYTVNAPRMVDTVATGAADPPPILPVDPKVARFEGFTHNQMTGHGDAADPADD